MEAIGFIVGTLGALWFVIVVPIMVLRAWLEDRPKAKPEIQYQSRNISPHERSLERYTNIDFIKEEKDRINNSKIENDDTYYDLINKKRDVLRKIRELKGEIASVNEIINSSKYGKSTLQIAEILEHKALSNVVHTLASLRIGGEEFFFISRRDVRTYLDLILQKSKKGGKEPIESQLRKYGYVYEYEILKETSNEVNALLEMHIYQSKKSQSPLNFRLPQGEEFQLIYILNEFEEEVLGVLVKELSLEHQLLQKFKEELLDLDNEKALLTSELEHAKKRREEFHVLLDRDREKLLAEMKKGFSSVETDIREILWDWLLEERGINKFLPNKTNDGISLGIGGLVEMKFPKGSEEPRVIFEKRVTALKAWTEDSGDGQLNYFLAQPYKNQSKEAGTKLFSEAARAKDFLREFNEKIYELDKDYRLNYGVNENATLKIERDNVYNEKIKEIIVGSFLDEGKAGYYSNQIAIYKSFCQKMFSSRTLD